MHQNKTDHASKRRSKAVPMRELLDSGRGVDRFPVVGLSKLCQFGMRYQDLSSDTPGAELPGCEEVVEGANGD